jgi:hypothetical protein
MGEASAIYAMFKDMGTPAITVAGFVLMMYMINVLKKNMAKLETKVSADIAKLETKVSADMTRLETKVSADMARLETKVSEDMARLETKVSADMVRLETNMAKLDNKVSVLAVDMKSIKGNHLIHIELAIRALSKGTDNEEYVREVLDASREVDLRMVDSEQVKTEEK